MLSQYDPSSTPRFHLRVLWTALREKVDVRFRSWSAVCLWSTDVDQPWNVCSGRCLRAALVFLWREGLSYFALITARHSVLSVTLHRIVDVPGYYMVT